MRATANVTSGVPPALAQSPRVLSGCPKARFPHGKPPKGMRARRASSSTHSAPTQTGANGSRVTRAVPIAQQGDP